MPTHLSAVQKRAIILICLYGVLKELKPSESFLNEYLVSVKGLTQRQTYDDVYPIWTYATFVFSFIVLLVADVIGYKDLILMEALAYTTTRVLLIYGESVLAFQFVEVAYALATATEVGYYAYIFRVVPRSYIPRAAGMARAAILVGRFLAAVIAQSYVAIDPNTNYVALNYISFVDVLLGLICAAFLPQPASARGCLSCLCRSRRKEKRLSLMPYETLGSIESADDLKGFLLSDTEEPADLSSSASRHEDGLVGHRPRNEEEDEGYSSPHLSREERKSWKKRMEESFHFIKIFFIAPGHIRWMMWWALGVCGYMQVENFYQNLWDLTVGHRSFWNGASSGAATLLGAVAALLPDLIERFCRRRHQGRRVQKEDEDERGGGGGGLTAELLKGEESGQVGSGGAEGPWQFQSSWAGWVESILFVIIGLALLAMAQSTAETVAISYIGFIIYHSLYAASAAIASAWLGVACRVTEPLVTGSSDQELDHSSDPVTSRLGFVIGCATFLGLTFESILEVIVGDHGLDLGIFAQFRVYAAFFIAVPIIQLVEALVEKRIRACRRQRRSLMVSDEGIETVDPYVSKEETA